MGRELKRVALDFDWPLHKVWKGFLNPHYRKCPSPDCRSGQTVARERLEAIVRLLVLSGEDAKRKVCHPYFNEANFSGGVPGADMVALVSGLEKAGEKIGTHCVEWAVEKGLMLMAGVDPETWGICQICGGDCLDPAVKAEYEAWRQYEPPKGGGWQMWETCSEGSPISPVCKSAEELAHWLADNKASTFGSMTANYETWLKMIKGSGWAMSMVMDEKGLRSGVDAVDDLHADSMSATPKGE